MSLAEFREKYASQFNRVSRPPNAMKPWTLPETLMLRRLARSRWSRRSIADALGRTLDSVSHQAHINRILIVREASARPFPAPEPMEAVGLYRLFAARGLLGELRCIIESTAARHGLSYADLIGDSRGGEIITARHEAMWLCCRDTTKSLPTIGRAFHRDHTTVLHAVRRQNKIRGTNVRGMSFPKGDRA